MQPPEGESRDTEQQFRAGRKDTSESEGERQAFGGPCARGRGERGGALASSLGAEFGSALWFTSLPCKYVCMCTRVHVPVELQTRVHVQEAGEKSCQCRPHSRPGPPPPPLAVSAAFCSAEHFESRGGGAGQEESPSPEEKNLGQGGWSYREGTERRGWEGEGPGRGMARAAPGVTQQFAVRCCFGSPVFTENLGFRPRPCS